MFTNNTKVGDVVAWANVEDGMMVSNGRYRAVRIGGRGTVVYEEFGVSGRSRSEADRWTTWAGSWPWPRLSSDSAKVIVEAVGLTGKESADELRRLAEVFEIREEIGSLPFMVVQLAMGPVDDPLTADGDAQAAERLHAAGWRAGMSAEDAARLLAAC